MYNIGGINEWCNIDIVNLICDRLDVLQPGKDIYRKQVTFVQDRPGHDRRYAMDSGKIRRELGWKAQVDFESGLERTVRWYIDNRDWWQRIKTGEYLKYYDNLYGDR